MIMIVSTLLMIDVALTSFWALEFSVLAEVVLKLSMLNFDGGECLVGFLWVMLFSS